jgi:CrcB protein
MWRVLLVGCGGFLGAVSRYGVSTLLNAHTDGEFPWGTWAVNVLGAFLIGFLSQAMQALCPERKNLLAFCTTGLLGGFTTFSTFSLETVNLLQSGELVWGCLNVALNVGCCLAGVLAGKLLAQALFC